MKNILKVMRFDFLTAKPLAFGGMTFAILLFGALSMLFSPMIASYITFAAMVFVIPLQEVADKSDFNKLYGTLPVARKDITRAKFLYIWLVYFMAELLELVIVVVSKHAKLYRIFPNQTGEMMQFVRESFSDIKLTLLLVFGLSAFFCLLFSYKEMMEQIHGRENAFKIMIISMGVLVLLAFAFAMLSEQDLIPVVSLPDLPEHVNSILILGVVMDIILLGICLLFGEITANKLAKLEL